MTDKAGTFLQVMEFGKGGSFPEPLQLRYNGGVCAFVLLCVPFGVRGEKQPFLGDFISSEVDTQHRAHESCPGGAHFSLFSAEASPRRDKCLSPVTASHSKHSCIPGRGQSCDSCEEDFLPPGQPCWWQPPGQG